MTSRPAFYSINDNQNHFVSEGKTTSRVLQQPGGTSSISLGWDDSSQTTGNLSQSMPDLQWQRIWNSLILLALSLLIQNRKAKKNLPVYPITPLRVEVT